MGAPGVVVMGQDCCASGCEVESEHRKLNGHIHFTYYIFDKFVFLFENTENTQKRPRN